jgi:4'-phosphopantetheinyl transferase
VYYCEINRFQSTLSKDERDRAQRFLFEKDRCRFIASRAWLRTILGHYLKISPDLLGFRYGLRGKPSLADTTGDLGLRFNLSHADDYALIAVALNLEIGIDIERIVIEPANEAIAEQIFTPHEIEIIGASPAEKRPEIFYRIWTCKEAYVKARGGGLYIPFNGFDVSNALHKKMVSISISESTEPISSWRIYSIDTVDGYAAALALEEKIGRVY